MRKVSVRNLQEAEGRFEFTIASDGFGDAEYYTNRNGEGLWHRRPGGDDRQISGTTQFSLNGVSWSTVRRRIVAIFS